MELSAASVHSFVAHETWRRASRLWMGSIESSRSAGRLGEKSGYLSQRGFSTERVLFFFLMKASKVAINGDCWVSIIRSVRMTCRV